jgi:integrase
MHKSDNCYATKEDQWPRVIKRGGSEVKIYRIKNRNRTAYQVAHWLAGKRLLKNFAKFAAARAYADEQATLLNSGHHAVARMHENDREAFVTALRILKPLRVPLLDAVKSYAAAVSAMGAKGSLLDAAHEFSRRHPTKGPRRTVSAVVDEFYAAKKQDGVSAVYLRTLRYHLNPLKERFRRPIGSVTASDLDAWLRGLGRTARTRRNALVSLTTLFRFARGLGYLPKNIPTEAEGVARPKVRGGKIEIISPDDLTKILHAADTDERKIYFALGAFTGIRATELSRLEWKDIDLTRRHVQVSAEDAKTATRRLVPICDSLFAWLLPYAKRKGRIFSSQRQAERLVQWAGEQIGSWPKNCLRHSFVSYRVAQSQDVAKTALEAGNTPAMIFSNYRELVSPEAAASWFAIMPVQKRKRPKSGKRRKKPIQRSTRARAPLSSG